MKQACQALQILCAIGMYAGLWAWFGWRAAAFECACASAAIFLGAVAKRLPS